MRQERDGYREIVADLLKRHHDIDLDELEAELRDWQENGAGIPLSELVDMLENEFGINAMSGPPGPYRIDASAAVVSTGVRVLAFRAVRKGADRR